MDGKEGYGVRSGKVLQLWAAEETLDGKNPLVKT